MSLNTSVSPHTNTIVISSTSTSTSTQPPQNITNSSIGHVTVGVGNGTSIAEQQNQTNNKQITINGKIARSASNISCENGGTIPMTTNNKNSDGKRKKSKSRSSTNIPQNQINSKNHLDAWLETCLKDSTAPQLSSSSEFLDYNQSSFNVNNKKPPIQQQFFTKTTYPAPFSQGFQKTVPDNPNLLYNPFYFKNLMRTPNHCMMNDASAEFASLPPIVNLTNINENNILDNNIDGNNDPSRNFRFSDPCLLNPSDSESKMSGHNTPNRQNFNNENGASNNNNNKLFITLMEQINLLHETNSKICRNLQDTKIDIEALKNSPNWGLRHRRDSLSGLSTHSQPMGFAFGTQSPAPTYHSGMYTPGMMTDVVREVKEAARVREDALLSRVKSMVEERSWSLGEGNIRMMRDIEELKSQIQHLRGDRKDSNKRITQLESENKYLKNLLTSLLNNKTNDIIHEHEFIRSTPINRKHQIDSSTPAMNTNTNRPRRHNSFNLHYGVINHSDDSSGLLNAFSSNDKKNAIANENNRRDSSTNQSTNVSRQNTTNNQSPVHHPYNGQLRIIENQFTTTNHQGNLLDSTGLLIGSTITNDNNDDDSQQNILQMEKDTIELRRELQETLASKKEAENRIIALENVVKNLQINDEKKQNTNHSGNKIVVVSGGGIGGNKVNDVVGGLIRDKENSSRISHGQNIFTNGSFTTNQRQLQNNPNHSGDFLISQNLNNNLNHITSQMQGLTSKFSLAGPITDL